MPSTGTPLISHNETIASTKSTNPSPYHQITSQNSSNLTHASIDDLHAEVTAWKRFAVDQIYILKKKPNEKQILSSNENEALKVESCKLYNNKYMITLTQIGNSEIFAFIAVLVFKLLSHKVLFINRKDNRNC